MEDMRIVKVVHIEESTEESGRWMRRLIIKILVDEIAANPKDIARFLEELEWYRPDQGSLD